MQASSKRGNNNSFIQRTSVFLFPFSIQRSRIGNVRKDKSSSFTSRVSIILLYWGWGIASSWRNKECILMVQGIIADPSQSQRATILLKSDLWCFTNFLDSYSFSIQSAAKARSCSYLSSIRKHCLCWGFMVSLTVIIYLLVWSVKMMPLGTFQLILFCSTVFLPSDQLWFFSVNPQWGFPFQILGTLTLIF